MVSPPARSLALRPRLGVQGRRHKVKRRGATRQARAPAHWVSGGGLRDFLQGGLDVLSGGDIALAMFRNVAASTGPLSGALFIGGAAAIGCADEAGVRSSRDAITIPTASEATMIKNE